MIETESTPQIPVPEVSLPGLRLRESREAARMSREEVAHHLHLDAQIIKALEEDNYEKLPSPIYICGYLRSYARLLKLPETEIVAAYTKGQEINASLIPENINILPGKKRTNTGLLKLIIPLLLLVVIAVVAIWLSEEADLASRNTNDGATVPLVIDTPIQQESAPITAPVEDKAPLTLEGTQDEPAAKQAETELVPPSADEIEQKIAEQKAEGTAQLPADETGANATQGDLHLVFHEDSWVEVTDSQGTRFVYRLEKAGAELFVDGRAPYKILLGKASGVDVYYKGEKFNHEPFHRDEIAYFRIGVAE